MANKELSQRKQEKLERAARAAAARHADDPTPNPVWFKPIMFGFMLLGLVWIVVYYITSSTLALPIPQLGQGNIFVGFGLIMVGFLMTTRWR
ncbi:cell division protein CrgA [Leucobacter sp. OH2974_COT-288]|uniref:Cell division protein CrgA n=1 Tax=Canibacter oris TaxID=1365628 RepID=A0A840DRG1_9MICO|nr:cell division protein CrgA [Canibacter oris]MBB4072099.1 hypothetical protein [Canibacter oris]RRD35602.1 cell division protein CrgA [Leucobacter sp. OH2974_COT-288]